MNHRFVRWTKIPLILLDPFKECMATRIVILEDADIQREEYRRSIATNPAFSCVGSYRTTEELVASLRPGECDVAILDLQLSGKSGVEAVRVLKGWTPAPLCIVLTVILDSSAIFEAFRAGADGYLLKSDDPRQFGERLSAIMAGELPVSAAVYRRILEHFRPVTTNESGLELLTDAERDVLELLASGYSNKEIAERRGCKVPTIRTQLTSIYQKLRVNSRTEAVSLVSGFGSRFLRKR